MSFLLLLGIFGHFYYLELISDTFLLMFVDITTWPWNLGVRQPVAGSSGLSWVVASCGRESCPIRKRASWKLGVLGACRLGGKDDDDDAGHGNTDH